MARIHYKTSKTHEIWEQRRAAIVQRTAQAAAEAKKSTITNNMFAIGYGSGVSYAAKILANNSVAHLFATYIIINMGEEYEDSDHSVEEFLKKWNDSIALVNGGISSIAASRDEVGLAQGQIASLEKQISDARNKMGIYNKWPQANIDKKVASCMTDIASNKARLTRAIEAAKITPDVDLDACIEAVHFITECVNGVFKLGGTISEAFGTNIASALQYSSGYNTAQGQVLTYFAQEKVRQGK